MKLKNTFLIFLLSLTFISLAQIPVLNSSPGITGKVIYLDFDGQRVIGTAWNSGSLIAAAPSTMNNANIRIIWSHVSEDYRPFDVNVTTDSVRFNNAPPNRRIRVVITPTSAWYGSAGGVAYVGSFTWGGTPGTPAWVFENQLGYSAKNIAEASSHEAGHAFTLRHQSTYSSTTCSKTAEYNPGVGTGVTSWAPIMGVGYSKNVTTWNFGTSSTSCTTIQYDHGNGTPGITSQNYLSFIQDDVGNTYATSKVLNLGNVNLLDSGIISQPTDIDAYSFTICNNRYVSFNIKPWALDTINYAGADLDIRFTLYNSANTLITTDTSLTLLSALRGVNLTPGSYYFTIDGGRSNNYTDYGSLGKYYVRIKATNPPTLNTTILTNGSLCTGQSAVLTSSSNGTPTTWQWTVAGNTTNVYTTANPSVNFPVSGVYTISLLASNSTSTSCLSTKTLNVIAPPVVSVSKPNVPLCISKTTTLVASGALSYTWLPGNVNGANQIFSPTVTTNYTVTGGSGICTSSLVTTVTVIPAFSVNVSSSSSVVCYGDVVNLTASGASNYTFEPGSIIANPAILSPTSTTSYTITGAVGNCLVNKVTYISVNPEFSTGLVVSATTLCVGESIYFAGSSGNSYVVNPGNIVVNPAVVSPTSSTNYSITIGNNGICFRDTVISISVDMCTTTGIKKAKLNEVVSIYPNPASSYIAIESNGNYESLVIISALGSLVHSQTLTDAKIIKVNTQQWPRGIYFVKLHSSKENSHIQKIVLE